MTQSRDQSDSNPSYQARLRRVSELSGRLDADPSALGEILAMLQDSDSAVVQAAAESAVRSLHSFGLEAVLHAVKNDIEALEDVRDQLIILNNVDRVDVKLMCESLLRDSKDSDVRSLAAELVDDLM